MGVLYLLNTKISPSLPTDSDPTGTERGFSAGLLKHLPNKVSTQSVQSRQKELHSEARGLFNLALSNRSVLGTRRTPLFLEARHIKAYKPHFRPPVKEIQIIICTMAVDRPVMLMAQATEHLNAKMRV